MPPILRDGDVHPIVAPNRLPATLAPHVAKPEFPASHGLQYGRQLVTCEFLGYKVYESSPDESVSKRFQSSA